MIVCSCTRVTDTDIARRSPGCAPRPLHADHPRQIYRALGKAPDCGGCIRLFVEKMRADDNLAVPVELRNLRHQPRQAQVEEV